MYVPLGTSRFVCGLISRIKFNIENTPWPDALISAHQRVCWVIHRAFPVVLLHDKVEEPHEDTPFLGYVLLRWLLQIIPLITPLRRRTCLDHSIDRYEHQLLWEVTGRAFVFYSFLFFFFLSMRKQKPHAKGSRLRNEGYVLSRFYDIELCTRAHMWGLVWAEAGRGQGQLSRLASWWTQVGLYSPRDGVLPSWLFSLHPGNVVELYNQGRNLLIRAQAKLILLFILLQCL